MMSPVMMKQVHQRTGQQYQVWNEAEHMAPVFPEHEEQRNNPERDAEIQKVAAGHIVTARSRKALPMTLTEDSAMAAAAMIGESSKPKLG